MLENGKPVFRYNVANITHYNIAAKNPLKSGKHTIDFDFQYDGGGIGKGGAGVLSIDGRQVAQGRIERTTPFRFSIDETFDVGEDTGTPVNLSYDVPFKFTGKIEKVVIKLGETKLGAADQEKLYDMERKARLAKQ